MDRVNIMVPLEGTPKSRGPAHEVLCDHFAITKVPGSSFLGGDRHAACKHDYPVTIALPLRIVV